MVAFFLRYRFLVFHRTHSRLAQCPIMSFIQSDRTWYHECIFSCEVIVVTNYDKFSTLLLKGTLWNLHSYDPILPPSQFAYVLTPLPSCQHMLTWNLEIVLTRAVCSVPTPCAYLPMCPPAHLPHLSMCPPAYVPTCQCAHLPMCPPAAYVPICLCVHLQPTYVPTCLCVHCPFAHLPMCPSVYVSTYSLPTCSPATCLFALLPTCPPAYVSTCNLPT